LDYRGYSAWRSQSPQEENMSKTQKNTEDLQKEIADLKQQLKAVNVLGYRGVDRDAAERKQEEEKYRSLFESSFDALMILGDKGFTDCNQATLDMFGIETRDDFIETQPWELSPPLQRDGSDSEEKARLVIEEASRHGSNRFEWTHRRKNGENFPAEVLLTKIELKGKVAYQATVRDITDKKMSETALKNALEQLKAIFDSSRQTSIIGTDKDGIITVFNKGAELMLGYSCDEVVGKQTPVSFLLESEVEAYAEELSKEFGRKIEGFDAFKTRPSIDGYEEKEWTYVKEDGTQIRVNLIVSVIKDENDNITGMVGLAQDITEVNKARKELKAERASLKLKVAERTAELTKSLKKIETANRHKGEFISSMSHELRTPLNGIMGSADLLHEQLFGALNPKQLNYTGQITKSADHLLSLINDILDMAKIDAGKMELDLVELDIDEWIRGAVGIMQAELQKKEIVVTILNDCDKKSITADSRKCNQIMLNLLSNALKYSPSGKDITIQISDASESMLRVEVHDQGIGIKDEDIDSVFSEFYQVDRVRDEQMGGTGIGLALTKRLVEMHKGTIGAKRSKEGGALFWFTISTSSSLKLEDEEAHISINIVNAIAHKGSKILIVEDNEMNINMMLDMLHNLDYDLSVAKNGQIAIDMVQTFKPDLVLMDMQMPVMDGFESTKRINEMLGSNRVPIIAVTASVTEESKEAQRKIGCVDHISKPFKRSALIEIVSKHL